MIKIKGITIENSLEKFLKKEGVYSKFCNNVNRPGEWGADDEGELIFIGSSFYWDLSPEGIDFWEELDTKFKR